MNRKENVAFYIDAVLEKPDRSEFVGNSGNPVQKANSIDKQVVKPGLPALKQNEYIAFYIDGPGKNGQVWLCQADF